LEAKNLWLALHCRCYENLEKFFSQVFWLQGDQIRVTPKVWPKMWHKSCPKCGTEVAQNVAKILAQNVAQNLAQNVAPNVAPNLAQPRFLSLIMHTLNREKNAPKSSVIFKKKLFRKNNYPIGENSPDLVTLFGR
jgi:hypothetical protein